MADGTKIFGHANDDNDRWAALLAIGALDFSKADEYWQAHASPMFKGLLGGPDFSFDGANQQYIRANGRRVKEDEIRTLLLALLASSADSMEQDAGKMLSGEIPLDQWQAAQAQQIKNLQIASYALGRGGFSNITEEDTKAIIGAKRGDGIAGSLKKLRRFGKQIEASGDTAETPAQITNRAGLYAGPAHTQFEAGRRAARTDAKDEDGVKIEFEEANVLDDLAEHCKTEEYTDGCPEVTDLGWQPMGTLPLPGLRTCGSSCRCRMKYRPIEKPQPQIAMSEKIEPIVGLILSSDEDFESALTLGTDLPKTRNGFKCIYYTKEMLKPDAFTDAKGKLWEITPKDVDDALADFNRALKLGHEPAIQDRHSKDPDRKGYGWVVGAKKNARGGLEWMHQFLGDESASDALKRKSSIMLIPNYTDEKGNFYKWWPDHSAMVLNPRLRDLEDFKPALAASDGQAVNAVYLTLADGDTPMDLTVLRAALGDTAKDQPDEKVLALCAEELTTTRVKLKDQTEANGVVVTELKKVERARDDALALAADPEPISPQLLALSRKSAATDIALALANGKIGAKQAEWLSARAAKDSALILSDDAEGKTKIDEMIEFAALGADDIAPKKPTVRGVPVKPLKGLALDDELDQGEPLTEERRAYLMGLAGHSRPVAKTA